MMSVYSNNTTLTSILKKYCPKGREKTKEDIAHKVRFEIPQQMRLTEVVEAVCLENNFHLLEEYVGFLSQALVNDDEFINIIRHGHEVVQKLDSKFNILVECVLSLSWTKRSPDAIKVFTEFCVDLMVLHTKYAHFAISKIISLWIPADNDGELWPQGNPVPTIEKEIIAIHGLLERILTVIPMTFDIVLHTIESKFPYFKKQTHVIAGYLHNLLQLISYKPIFTEFVMQLILQKLIILDVNAPRCEIEETEDDDDVDDEDDDENRVNNELIFPIENCRNDNIEGEQKTMNHPIANTLDICMEKMYSYFDQRSLRGLTNPCENPKMMLRSNPIHFFKTLLNVFDNVVLPIHNTHHVQFLLFYYCSFENTLSELLLSSLWNKIINPNVSGVIRQAAVGYMASFIARSKVLQMSTLKFYLKQLSNWAHQYIESSDQYRSNGSLKANLVFFSVCQAIFYVIAFRSRDLTTNKSNLLFLQSLQLSALVTCNFNPLRVCLPAVATTFAGVTRAYQLAYCHTILERNARRKLATVYANDTSTPEEVLDTFFPFDPYLLKISGYRIHKFYLQYQASEAEEHICVSVEKVNNFLQRRKRGDSEMAEDIDDFLVAEKKQKFVDLAKNQERNAQFTYGLSPGFHV